MPVTMPVLTILTAGSPVLPRPWPKPTTRASTPKTANCSFPAPYALPDVRGPCSAASPYRVRCWAIAGELVIIHGQTDQLKIAAAARQREFLDRVAGDEAELAAYRKAWDALAAMDERLERLRSQESSARQQADYLRESIDRINRTDPQPGEDEELKARRERIENAADIAQGVGSALGALDASQVDVDAADGASAVELINHAVTSLRAIRVGGTFAEQADRLESINADLGDVVFALSQELGDEGSVRSIEYNRAATALELGRAQEAYDALIRLGAESAMELHKLAAACELLGKRDEALAALERAEDPTTPSPEPARELAPRICGLVRYRLEHPDYLERPEYGAELMELFETMRRELPIGYASFHLPRVLEWLRARRMYRQAYELLLDFPGYRALNKT
mgnify:CR=1 FL=1